MSHPYIIFNGKSSEDPGFIIQELPEEPLAARNIEEVDIPGRDGSLVRDLGGYQLVNTRLKINPNGKSITDVYAFLNGEGWLTTSDETQYMRWVGFWDQTTDTRFRASGKCYDTVTIPFRMWPYKHLVNQTALTYTTQPQTFPGQGNTPSAPIITVEGSGSINLLIGGGSVLIDNLNGSIVIDCDARTAYTLGAGVTKVFAGRQVTLPDDWPTLKPEGETNTLSWTGSVTSVKIDPWWRWL